MFGIYEIYFFLKIMLFFSIVKALVRFETLQNHVLFLGVLYTSLVAFISYVFIGPDSFRAEWLLRINRATGLSPWLAWLAVELVISTVYFKLLSKFDEGILFWILLILGVPLVFL